MPSSPIERITLSTGLRYAELVEAFEAELGYLFPPAVKSLVEDHAEWAVVEKTIAGMAGKHDLMVIFRANQGAITSLSKNPKQCSLYLVGNPVIADKILDIDLDACLYVPFRICLFDDGDPGGAVMSYDLPSSSLAVLGNPQLAEFGQLLDKKVEGLVEAINQRKLNS